MEKQLETKGDYKLSPIVQVHTNHKSIPQGVNLNVKNMQNIQFEIQRKKYSEQPYYATKRNVVQVITDYDELPYRRWYRGFPESDVPIVAEREAGYRPLIRQIYIEKKLETPQCFSKQTKKQDSTTSSKQGLSKQDSDRQDSRQGYSNRQRNGQGDFSQDFEKPSRQSTTKQDPERQSETNIPNNGGWGNTDNYTSVMLRTL